MRMGMDARRNRAASGRKARIPRWISAHPRSSRAIFAISTILILFGILGVARVTGSIDPRLWNLLELPLVEGTKNTMIFAITIIPLGLLMGFAVGWARFSRHPYLSWPATVYVDFVRGVPPLIMVMFAFFWLPTLFKGETFQLGLAFAVFALAVHTSAYQAEIFRAGFQSISRGQIEAGQAMGLTYLQIMRSIILPQTFRVTLPALGNEFALIIKDSSLLAAVGAAELVYWGRNSAQFALTNYGIIEWVMITWVIIALLYFVITYLVTQTVAAVEHSFRVPGLGSVAF
jgi:polar amino acid transport system permease protein